MAVGPDQRYDFFLSRRGSVAAVAREVADVLTEKGYNVLVQDYDAPISSSFVEMMHEAVKNSRDLVVLFTRDYEHSPYTRKEFTSFEAQRLHSLEKRYIIVLRCEDVPLEGLLADSIFQDLVGVTDPEERKHRIISAADRQSLSARPPPRPFIGVPPRIASFTGRADELDRLDAILMHDKPAAVTQSVGRAAVQGLGGVGKTSLATEYAHRYRQLYAGVCWCPAETRTELMTSLAGLAVTLGAAAADEADVEKAAKAALRSLGEQRATWLLVYDNVGSPDEIADLLPSDGARVLITSRFSDWNVMADEVSLDVLPVEECVTFLQTRTNRTDANRAKSLAEALGCLPLALDHAAAYCRRTQLSFAHYAAKAASLTAAVPRGVGYPRSVEATFDLAISQAVSQSPAAEKLMSFLAHCAPERIPMVLVEGATDSDHERYEGLAALADFSLLKHDPFADGTPAITVHRLVQAVGRARAAQGGVSGAITAVLTSQLIEAYPDEEDAFGNPLAWPLCAYLTPHVVQVASDTAAKNIGLADLLNRLGSYHYGRAAYEEAEHLFRRALTLRQGLLGTRHQHTALSTNNLALVLWEKGDASTAQRLFEEALIVRDEVLGPEHPETAETLNNLGTLLNDQGKASAARPLLERALAIYENAYGAAHPWTARALNNLGTVLLSDGDLTGAQSLLERALAVREKVLGREHPDTAMSLTDLAQLFRQQGTLSEARRLLQRALAIYEKMRGPDHPATASALNGLAQVHSAEKNWAAALQLFQRALTIRENIYGPESPDTKYCACLTADTLDNIGRVDEASALRERYGLTQSSSPS
jgi:tetratricopeptide (TPR) repeat protein